MKNERVGGFIGDVAVRQLARVALPASALGVISVVFQIAAARPALTSQGTQKLDWSAEQFFCSDYSHFISLYDALLIQHFKDNQEEKYQIKLKPYLMS